MGYVITEEDANGVGSIDLYAENVAYDHRTVMSMMLYDCMLVIRLKETYLLVKTDACALEEVWSNTIR